MKITWKKWVGAFGIVGLFVIAVLYAESSVSPQYVNQQGAKMRAEVVKLINQAKSVKRSSATQA